MVEIFSPAPCLQHLRSSLTNTWVDNAKLARAIQARTCVCVLFFVFWVCGGDFAKSCCALGHLFRNVPISCSINFICFSICSMRICVSVFATTENSLPPSWLLKSEAMPQTTVAIKMTLTKSLRLRRRVPLVFILKNGLYAKYVDVY
jgi:hypothetical protein